MGASTSRLDQLEELVRSLRAANAQLERQLSTVGKETDAAKRAELLSFIQAENGKMMRENERNQMQLADELQALRQAAQANAATDSPMDAQVAKLHALKSSITQMNARLAALLRQPRADVSDASSAAPSSPPSSLPSGADDLATFALLVQQLEERVRVATTEGTAAMHALAKAQAGAKEEQATMRLEIQARDAEIQQLHTKQREQEKDKAQQSAQMQTMWVRVGELLARDRGVPLRCVVQNCAGTLSLRAAVPGGAAQESSPCISCADGAGAEGVASSEHKGEEREAAYFCSNGHPNRCEPCWGRVVQSSCATLVQKATQDNEKPGPGDASADHILHSKTAADLIPARPILKILPREVQGASGAQNTPASPAASPSPDSSASPSSTSAAVVPLTSTASSEAVDLSSYTRRTCPSCTLGYQHDVDAAPDQIPRLLQCAHTLCTACTKREVADAKSCDQKVIDCPTCREPTVLSDSVPVGVPSAAALIDLLQRTKAAVCEECCEAEAAVVCAQCPMPAPLCQLCFDETHLKSRNAARRAHTAQAAGVGASSTSPSPTPLCSQHSKPLVFFCAAKSCMQALCETCATELHRNDGSSSASAPTHVLMASTAFAADYRKEIERTAVLTHAEQSVTQLAHLSRAWLQQAVQAQEEAQGVQQMIHQQTVVRFDKLLADTKAHVDKEHAKETAFLARFTELLHHKAETYVSRGVQRRSKQASVMSQLSVLLELARTTLANSDAVVARDLFALIQQVELQREAPKLEQLDMTSLSLSLYSRILSALPAANNDAVIHLEELLDAPLQHCAGEFVRKWGSQGSANGKFNAPAGAAVSGGLVYVADGSNHRVQVFSAADSKFVCQWGGNGSADGQFSFPRGLAVSGGLVYVADEGNHRLQVFSAVDSKFVCQWGSKGSADGQFSFPRGLAVSGGLVYVTDSRNHRVQVFSAADNSFVRTWGSEGSANGKFNAPVGVAVSGGLVYVADYGNHRVQVFSAADGSFVRQWGSEGSADGQFSKPEGVAVSGGLVYVADHNNHRVQVFSAADGSSVRQWGSKGSADGQFSFPRGLAVSGGLVYVADHNHRVQVFRC